MDKRTRALLMLASVLGTASATTVSARSATGYKSTLSVNDPDAVGTVGDSLLSLDEAIRLANGRLTLDRLSASERAQVRGRPGPASKDMIRIVLGAGKTITSPVSSPEGVAISELRGNDGDALDGGGAKFRSPVQQGVGLLIASSDFTLSDIGVENFVYNVRIDFGGQSMRDVRVERVHTLASKLVALDVGAQTSNGSLHGLTVTDSVFDATGTDALVVMLSAKGTTVFPKPGAPVVTNVALEDVLFTRNETIGGNEGMYVSAGISATSFDHAFVRRAKVVNNRFRDVKDGALDVSGPIATFGAHASDSGTEDVLVDGNTMNAVTFGIWAGAAEATFQGAKAERGYLRRLVVSNNVVVGTPGARGECIDLETARADKKDEASDNEMTDVRVEGNRVTGCPGFGIGVHAGAAYEEVEATTNRNVARNISILRNDVRDSLYGIAMQAMYAPLKPTNGTGNAASGIHISDNRLQGNGTGLWLVGGDAPKGGRITGNTLSDVTFARNSVTGSGVACASLADNGPGVTGNVNRAVCPRTPSEARRGS